ncbi:DUF7560 family zinc ribbon protein [Halorientalis halophila]
MTDFEFECPHCGERFVVDDGALELLIADGCVACGDQVTREAVVEAAKQA